MKLLVLQNSLNQFNLVSNIENDFKFHLRDILFKEDYVFEMLSKHYSSIKYRIAVY